MRKLCICLSTILLLLPLAAISRAEQFTTTPNGLKYRDLKIGRGMKAELGSTALIHFIGWLDENGQRGKEIYNSRKEKHPVSFVVGTENVIQGWQRTDTSDWTKAPG